MHVTSGIVGATAGPRAADVDARWLMAYAASLGDTAADYLDTARADGIVGHPLFPVCYEWPLALDLRAQTMSEEIGLRGVHATHDLHLHRRPRPGDRLLTRATVVAVRRLAPGTLVVTRFATVDAGGRPVSTTDYGSIYRGVSCDADAADGGAPHVADRPVDPPVVDWAAKIPVSASLAHVYTECARIWNPIHTDRAVALAAGLPDIILHGTAILALAVSEILRRQPRGASTGVSRIRCRFRGMVALPSAFTVEAAGPCDTAEGTEIAFRAISDAGRPAIDGGVLTLGSQP